MYTSKEDEVLSIRVIITVSNRVSCSRITAYCKVIQR